MKDEQGFLRELLAWPDDRTTRLVYADWLEECDDPDSAIRAEFLRLELRLTELQESAAEREAVRARLLELREEIDEGWLASLDQALIENCSRFSSCPLRWEKLPVSGSPKERFCDSCRRWVFYFRAVEDARSNVALGLPVVVDSRISRTENDLEPGPASKRWWQFWKRSR